MFVIICHFFEGHYAASSLSQQSLLRLGAMLLIASRIDKVNSLREYHGVATPI